MTIDTAEGKISPEVSDLLKKFSLESKKPQKKQTAVPAEIVIDDFENEPSQNESFWFIIGLVVVEIVLFVYYMFT